MKIFIIFFCVIVVIIIISLIEEYLISQDIKYSFNISNPPKGIKIIPMNEYKKNKYTYTNNKIIFPKILLSTCFKNIINNLKIRSINKKTILSDIINKICGVIVPLFGYNLIPKLDYVLLVDKSFNNDVITDLKYCYIV